MKNPPQPLARIVACSMLVAGALMFSVRTMPFAFALELPGLPQIPTFDGADEILEEFFGSDREDVPGESAQDSEGDTATGGEDASGDPVADGDGDGGTTAGGGGTSSAGSTSSADAATGGGAVDDTTGSVADDADGDAGAGTESSAGSTESSAGSAGQSSSTSSQQGGGGATPGGGQIDQVAEEDGGPVDASPEGDADSDSQEPQQVNPSLCQGREPTVYVNEDGFIVGGNDAGRRYRGTLEGSVGDDVILGTDRADKIKGLGGNDIICGKGGNDDVAGGSGNDTVTGGEGDDEIEGDAGDDVLCGDAGNDTLEGGIGNDTLCGGEGEDELEGDSGDDTLDGGPGLDDIDGNSGTDTCSAHEQGERRGGCEKVLSGTPSLCLGKVGDDDARGGDEDGGGGGADEEEEGGGEDGEETEDSDDSEDAEDTEDAEDAEDGEEGGTEDGGQSSGSEEQENIPEIRIIRTTSGGNGNGITGGRSGGGSRTRRIFAAFGFVHHYVRSTAGRSEGTLVQTGGGEEELPAGSIFSIPRIPQPGVRAVAVGTPLSGLERRVICTIVKVIDYRDDRGVRVLRDDWVQRQLADYLGRDRRDIRRALRSPDLCSDFGGSVIGRAEPGREDVAVEETGPVVLYVDEDGIPVVPGDSQLVRVWNNCIRNTPTLRIDPNDPTNIRHYNCARYRTASSRWGGYVWLHPEYGFPFGWNYRLNYLVLSEEHADMVVVKQLHRVVTAEVVDEDTGERS